MENEDLDERLDKIEALLNNPENGLIVRLDRMEQMQKIRLWWLGAIAVAAISGLVSTAISLAAKAYWLITG